MSAWRDYGMLAGSAIGGALGSMGGPAIGAASTVAGGVFGAKIGEALESVVNGSHDPEQEHDPKTAHDIAEQGKPDVESANGNNSPPGSSLSGATEHGESESDPDAPVGATGLHSAVEESSPGNESPPPEGAFELDLPGAVSDATNTNIENAQKGEPEGAFPVGPDDRSPETSQTPILIDQREHASDEDLISNETDVTPDDTDRDTEGDDVTNTEDDAEGGRGSDEGVDLVNDESDQEAEEADADVA